ncbi:hypothetical protein KA075_01985 [Candidatus Saccharibacteria bacterium]|jgi:hypothetical protein|nr:hypothetical protein [Candidatus Saccharibacteria bacterium]
MEEIKPTDREAFEAAEAELPEYCARSGKAGGCSYVGRCAAILYAAQSVTLGRVVDKDWIPQSEKDFNQLQLSFAGKCAEFNASNDGRDLPRFVAVQLGQ